MFKVISLNSYVSTIDSSTWHDLTWLTTTTTIIMIIISTTTKLIWISSNKMVAIVMILKLMTRIFRTFRFWPSWPCVSFSSMSSTNLNYNENEAFSPSLEDYLLSEKTTTITGNSPIKENSIKKLKKNLVYYLNL